MIKFFRDKTFTSGKVAKGSSCVYAGSKWIIMKVLQKYSFGLLTVTAILLASFTGTGCRKKDKIAPMENPPNSTAPTKTLLALGDSYTIGESVAEADRFPNQTIKLLSLKGLGFTYPATIIARTGWTTQNLLDAIAAASDANSHIPYDAVTLLIGVNNQFQGRDTAEYRIQFTECLNKALFFSGNKKEHVFVVSIPDWGVTPFGASYGPAQVATAIDRFNAINKEVTEQRGIAYINITPVSRQNDPSLVAGDGLHPSGKQYGLWAQILAPVMERQLR